MNIREARPQSDFPRIAALVTAGSIDPMTTEDMHEDENRIVQGKIRRRWVAVNAQDEVIGYGYTVKYPSEPVGHFHIVVHVDKQHQRQGIGAALYETAEKFAREQGATSLACAVLEIYPQALAWAQKHGFNIRLQEIGLHLDLTNFDENRFAHWLENAEKQGIRITTLSEVGNTPENQNKLYEINRIASMDDPAATGDRFMTLENWRRIIAGASWFQPEGQVLAIDTARDDLYIGMSGITYDEENNTAGTTLTGVHPDYRGRGVAQALKFCATQFALKHGATVITTTCDARNNAMIAINRKLGFEVRPGYYELTKTLT
jgi:GNAT superfamily N-acetyltransferase